jgi:hypothetical protein
LCEPSGFSLTALWAKLQPRSLSLPKTPSAGKSIRDIALWSSALVGLRKQMEKPSHGCVVDGDGHSGCCTLEQFRESAQAAIRS